MDEALREQMALDIFIGDNWVAAEENMIRDWARLEPEYKFYAYAIADALIAKGYKKYA